MSKKTTLNLREWWDEVGTENVRRVIERLESSLPYFRQMRYGFRAPSGAMALRIVEAAARITPGYVPDIEKLIAGVPKANAGASRAIAPSPRFIAAQRRSKAKRKAAAARV